MREFTIVEHRKLGEALEYFDHKSDVMGGYSDHFAPVVAAARLTYDRYQECEECEGKGGSENTLGMERPEFVVCPRCGGSGLLPKQAQYPDEDVVLDGPLPRRQIGAVRAFDKETE
jgi:hypothetical protein